MSQSAANIGGLNWDGLISLCYEAVLDSELWPEAANQIAVSFGHAATTLSWFEGGKGQLMTGALDEVDLQLYNERYGGMDPHAARAPKNTPIGVMLRAEGLVPPAELEMTPYCNEFMKKLGICYGTAGVLRADENGMEVLAMFRAKGQGPFTDEELQTLFGIGSHLRRARTVYHRLRALTHKSDRLASIVSSLRAAVIICDERGRVLTANGAAAADLAVHGVLQIDKGGCLTLRKGVPPERLRSALREAGAGIPGCVAVHRRWPRGPGSEPWSRA